MDIELVRSIIEDYFVVIAYRGSAYEYASSIVEFLVEPKSNNIEQLFDELYMKLSSKNIIPILDARQGVLTLRLIERPEVFHTRSVFRKILPLILFLVTVTTVYISGIYLSMGYRELVGSRESIMLDALLYSVSLMGVLLVHELGHYIVARLSGVPVSLPYFIPAPPASIGLLGTFGAVINMRLPPKSINRLALIGLMGPLVGYIAAIPVALLGLNLSAKIPLSEAHKLAGNLIEIRAVPLTLKLIMDYSIRGNVTILSHPVMLAAYFLFLITFLNLLPIGQLDGGHIVRSLTSTETHRIISMLVSSTLMVLGIVLAYTVDPIYMIFVFFSVLALILTGRREHVGVLNNLSILSGKYRIIPLVYVILLILTIPIPG